MPKSKSTKMVAASHCLVAFAVLMKGISKTNDLAHNLASRRVVLFLRPAHLPVRPLPPPNREDVAAGTVTRQPTRGDRRGFAGRCLDEARAASTSVRPPPHPFPRRELIVLVRRDS